MAGKPVWANDLERDLFVEHNCRICFQPKEAEKRLGISDVGCPHLARAEENKLPKVWTKRRGNDAVLGKTFKCDDFLSQPAVNRRGTAPADTESMFGDMPSMEKSLVPVDGWPDYQALQRKSTKGDHQ